MNISLLTNLIALAIVIAGLLMSGPPRELVLNTGLFALSGGITNWLAVHMLFEKVPGFYGSGVIPARFEEFKLAIKSLIMEQFFSPHHIGSLFNRYTEQASSDRQAGLRRLVDKVDLDKAFESLVEVIMNSSFGGMLNMVGGRGALTPLKEPFVARMREFLLKVGDDKEVLAQLQQVSTQTLLKKVEFIVDQRLQELTPRMVKTIVQQLVKEHLGWLVVWGGVLGGVLGLAASLLVL